MRARVEKWVRGDPLTARKLNRASDAIDEISGAIPEPVTGSANTSGSTSGSDAIVTDDQPQEVLADETWTFVSSETREERLEDPDDEDTFILVDVVTSVVVRKPNGGTVKIEFE